jgi:dTDP-4-amino-4,6-dideoxygalactose transaminase
MTTLLTPVTATIPVARPYIGVEEEQAVVDVLRSGWVTQGPRVAEFEARFSKYIGCDYSVAVSSCTTALHLALLTVGVGPGDEVICPSLSFIATANAIAYTGATPIFSDIFIIGRDHSPFAGGQDLSGMKAETRYRAQRFAD